MLQEGIDFCRMGSGMDAREDDLVFPDEREFPFFQFFYFSDEIAGCVNIFHRIGQLGTGGYVGFISKAGPFASAFLYQHITACTGNHSYFCRCGDDTVFIGFNIF